MLPSFFPFLFFIYIYIYIYIYILWHLQVLADLIILNLCCVISIGADCLLIIVICYSYFISSLHDFPSRIFRYDLYINSIADSFH